MQNWNFRYFDDLLANAEFTDSPCESCGSEVNCLDGIYFDEPDFDRESICIECLVEGKVKVQINHYLIEKLKEHIANTYPNKEEARKIAHFQVTELEKTPPVPWIQQNDWVVCCGEFAKYIGEWEQEKFNVSSTDGNGLEHLMSILEKDYRDRIEDVTFFWEDIGNDTAVYVFECLRCSKKIAIWQSY
jgi:uncharacterized protein CbrC (UPF0167 family)